MITVAEALAKVLALAKLTDIETVPLRAAAGRVLAQPVQATRDQPPFAASSMDGYAICAEDFRTGAQLKVLGEAAAGDGFDGTITPGTAARIFTGAPVPQGASRVVIQEDVDAQGDHITIRETSETNAYIRPAGADFTAGQSLAAPQILSPQHIALLASMNIAEVPVRCQPVVALISTGSELMMPGEAPGPDQIIASNTFGLAAMLETAGAEIRLLPIAHDTLPALRTAFDLARGADLIVTIGGASVGDHDLVGDVAAELGMERAFYKIAMRPGKPLMAGRLDGAAMVGLPGNPVSAMVCGVIFLRPLLRAMLGLGAEPEPHQNAPLAHDIPANGPRAHYMRGVLKNGQLTVFERQDSALLTVLADANVLVLRAPNESAQSAGTLLPFVHL